MSRIRGKDTTPEIIVRSLLHRMGYRFRLHVRIPIHVGGTNSVSPHLKEKSGTLVPPFALLPRSATFLFQFLVTFSRRAAIYSQEHAR